MGNELIANLKRLKGGSRFEFAAALMQEGRIEEKECKRRCPVDTRTLQNSINLQGPVIEQDVIKAFIRAGEPGSGAEAYAVVQHEDLDLDHPNGGEAKFIEAPLRESAPFMLKRLAERIDLNKVFSK